VRRQTRLINDLHDLDEWNPTPEGVRDAVLVGHVTGSLTYNDSMVLPPEVARFSPSGRDVDLIAGLCHQAISSGRLIDFGWWTNDAIKHGGVRGGPLYTRGVLGHPFTRPWMYMHRWEGAGAHTATSVYLVNPLEPDIPGGDCECIELNPLRYGASTVLMIGDRIFLQPARNVTTQEWSKYHCEAIPSPWRCLPGAPAEANNNKSPASAAAANVLDPLMTGLLILSTRGIVRERVEASEKLQRARARNRRPPIPPYERVDCALYITAIQARKSRARTVSLGGTHASPIPHLRMGHVRTYASGVTVLVRDALVNMDEATQATWRGSSRSHYVVKS
jgi:hypothetical protein